MTLKERIQKTVEDPLAVGGLLINLIPIFAVLFLGWGAAPLVFLYWLENIVMGFVTLARMTASTMKQHPIGLIGMLFYGPFFTVHYGLFCIAHGWILAGLAGGESAKATMDFEAPEAIFEVALASGAYMPLFLAVIAGWQTAVYVIDFLWKGQFRNTSLEKEMVAPYGNIVVLHIAIIFGAWAVLAFGENLVGVLALILLRAAWGVFLDMRRVFKKEPEAIKS
ncbi:MAG: DUF6498-containing protein [Pseudomonadota bacterium]